MATSFMGIEIGKRSILTHQAALNTTGHNVANANTTGYSRQAADIVTTIPYPVPSLVDGQRVGQFGTGVDIAAINRIRDAFVDGQIRSENQVFGYWSQVQDGLDKVETVINEPSEDGLRSVMDKFWQAWQDLSANPESEAVRSVVVQRGLALSEAFKATFKELTDLRDDINASIKIKTADINTLAINIADLNQQILTITSAGMQPNDLLDKRDLLVDELSLLADIEVFQKDNGMIDLQLGDRLLVQGKDCYKLTTVADDAGMHMVIWQDTQLRAKFTNGEMRGLLDLRGKTDLRADRYSDYKELLPDMINNLNELAKTLVIKINEVHRAGYSLNNKQACPDGTDFFTMPDADPDLFENWADNMIVNQNLINNVKNLAAAQHRTWEKNSSNADVRANFGDGSNALAIAQLKHNLNEVIYPIKTEGLTLNFDTSQAASHLPVTIRIDTGSGPQNITLDPPANFRDLKEMAEKLQEEIDARDLGVEVRIEGKSNGSGGELVFYSTSTTKTSMEFIYPDSGIIDLSATGLQNGEYSLITELNAAAAAATNLNLVQTYCQGNAHTIVDGATLTLVNPDNLNASIQLTIADINTATRQVIYSYTTHEYTTAGVPTTVNGNFTLTYGVAGPQTVAVGNLQLTFEGLETASELNLVEGDKGVYNVTAGYGAGAYHKLTIAADYNHNPVGQHSQSFVFNDGVLDGLINTAINFININDNPRSDEYGKTYDGSISLTTGVLAAPGLSGEAAAHISFYDAKNMETFMIDQQTTDDFWRSVAAEIGVKNQEAIRMVKNEDMLLNELETKRQSVSGVSMDEEMTNMIKFNHGFSAASRFITVVDEQLETIINRMGLAGR
ncbi:MAG: flagellar hook-associated protein FlgK [Syntrophomonadaceae bacterium]|nr:flagellar hook-associated protein FlgK [Syntrophomonadaceae bacterium]